MDERTSDPKRIFGYPCVSSQTSAQLSLALTLRLLSVVFGIWLWRLAQNSALHVAQDQTSALTQTVDFRLGFVFAFTQSWLKLKRWPQLWPSPNLAFGFGV